MKCVGDYRRLIRWGIVAYEMPQNRGWMGRIPELDFRDNYVYTKSALGFGNLTPGACGFSA